MCLVSSKFWYSLPLHTTVLLAEIRSGYAVQPLVATPRVCRQFRVRRYRWSESHHVDERPPPVPLTIVYIVKLMFDKA